MLGEFFIIKRNIIDSFDKIFSKDDMVLDIGCGNKPYYHKKIKAKIICADKMQTKKGHIICDATFLPIKKSKFDGVVCVNSLYYYSDPFNAIKEFSSVLRKNGRLIIVTPFFYPVHDAPEDKYRFTEYGLKEILKDKFTIKEIKAIGGIFNLPAIFFHSLIKGLPLLFQKFMRPIINIFTIIIFYIPYIIAQIFSLLDFLDRTKRWTSYYFVVAIKR